MASLPFAITIVIGAFAPLFSKRVFALAKLLLVGAILAPGKRTVTAVLRVMGKSADTHFQNYHRVLIEFCINKESPLMVEKAGQRP
jgi:hypothetical protein